MARPEKTGLDYFPFDVDFFQDIKVRKLIKYRGCQAVPVYTFLLCRVYQNGYYLKWDEDLPFVISEATGYEEQYVNEVVETCATVGLFSADLFRQKGILTSKGIQERYVAILRQLKRKVVFSEFNIVNSEETGVNSEVMPVNSAKSTQRKEKEIKEKEREEDDKSSFGDVPDFVKANRENLKNNDPPELRAAPLTLDEYEEELRSNRMMLETACMSKRVTESDYQTALREFFADKRAIGHKPRSQQDINQHFLNWLPGWKERQKSAEKPGKLAQVVKTAVDSVSEINNEGGFITYADLQHR